MAKLRPPWPWGGPIGSARLCGATTESPWAAKGQTENRQKQRRFRQGRVCPEWTASLWKQDCSEGFSSWTSSFVFIIVGQRVLNKKKH